jgi:flagellar biosynthesis chaperone FliJ
MMLTLEERERLAYISNSPDHALLVEVLDMQDQILELEDANDQAKSEIEELEDQVDSLERDLQEALNNA